MPHGKHIFDKAYDTAIATMCAHPESEYELPHWKCFLRCCSQYPNIDLPE